MWLKLFLLISLVCVPGGLSCLAELPASSQRNVSASADQAGFGRVDMEVSCSPSAQSIFQEGVALIHSFWWDEARSRFQAAARIDPACAMAYWGEAMTYNDGLHAPPSSEDIQKALRAVERAHAAKPPTPREQAYVDAVDRLYRGYPQLGRPERDLGYSQAMEKIYRTYPGDSDGVAFYVLSLLALGRRSGNDGYELQVRGAEILEPLFAALETHPGVAHYLIHAYDDSGHRDRGIAAARRYSRIAAAVPHALHMPSHIFAGLGMWDENIASNQASFQASEDEGRRKKFPPYRRNYHALGYWVYGLLETGRFREARALMDVHRPILLASGDRKALRYLHDIEVRLRLEIRDWKEAAGIEAVLDTPFESAETLYVRGLGLARTGDTASAKRTLGELESAIQGFSALTDPALEVRKQIVSIQAQQLAATILMAQQRGEEAITLMEEACQIEDNLAVSQFPPDSGTGLPAHEFFGEVLLELGKPEEARRQFEMALQKTPGRMHSLSGLAKATGLSGDSTQARVHYMALLDLLAHSDAELPQLQEARIYVASLEASLKP